MRTSIKTIVRREHWRWQPCGPGRLERRRVLVRASVVKLGPTDARQLNLLDRNVDHGARRTSHRRATSTGPAAPDHRPVLRSYWRRQPYGPGSGLRKTILVDVHG